MKPLIRLAFLFAAPLLACSSSKSNESPDASPPGDDAGIDAGDDASADAGPTCPSSPVADALRTQRDACTFAAGAKVADTLGITDDARKAIPIKHVIVLMKENRSFDHIFGQLSNAGQPDAEKVPSSWAPLDKDGKPVAPFHQTTTCVHNDPPHQWDAMHAQSNGGKMDGFVTSATASDPPSDGTFVMGYYTDKDIPFYYWLANTYSIADRYFPSVLSGTWSNRDYLVAATSKGIKDTGSAQLSGVPIIFDQLQAAGVSWNVYSDDIAPLEFSVAWGSRKPYLKLADLVKSLGDGSLPSVSFIDATTPLAPPESDEHPPGDVQLGEQWTKALYDAVVKSPKWNEIALFFTYDEAGGFADHVPPPTKSCAASADQSEFVELGMRVPMIVISPWARRHFVSHEVHQHTSILRFIELLFDVPALTARDANSDALLDMFDFTCGNTQAIGDAPAAGTGGCN